MSSKFDRSVVAVNELPKDAESLKQNNDDESSLTCSKTFLLRFSCRKSFCSDRDLL